MLKQIFVGSLISIFLLLPAFAGNGPAMQRPLFFLELWNNVSFYDTNLEKNNFASLLGRFEGKAGINVFDLPLQIYGVYYGVASQTDDYWNNSLYSGGGVRLKPFESYQGSSWLNEWIRDIKFFAESLSSSYLKNASSAEVAGLKENDERYGIEIWHEWNLDNPDESLPWGELWTNYSYRSTNFTTDDSGSYILYFQPKVGRHLGGGIEIYLRGDLTSSDKDDYWLNIADYGIGLRFEPWRETAKDDDLLKKFKMFAEVLSVSYLKDKPADPNKEVSSDIRFGIDFSYGR